MPANVAVSISFGQIAAASLMNVHDANPLNPLGMGDSGELTDVLEQWLEVVDPEAAGLALGIESELDWTLEEYEVTRPAAGKIAVHLVKRSGTQVDQNSNPIVEEIDAIFTLDAGLIVSVEVASNIPNNSDEGVTTLAYDPVVVGDEFEFNQTAVAIVGIVLAFSIRVISKWRGWSAPRPT